jgi:hypothetical protein
MSFVYMNRVGERDGFKIGTLGFHRGTGSEFGSMFQGQDPGSSAWPIG